MCLLPEWRWGERSADSTCGWVRRGRLSCRHMTAVGRCLSRAHRRHDTNRRRRRTGRRDYRSRCQRRTPSFLHDQGARVAAARRRRRRRMGRSRRSGALPLRQHTATRNGTRSWLGSPRRRAETRRRHHRRRRRRWRLRTQPSASAELSSSTRAYASAPHMYERGRPPPRTRTHIHTQR
jgi:hypothetical protein